MKGNGTNCTEKIILHRHMLASQLFVIRPGFQLIQYFIQLALLLKILTSNTAKMNPDVVASSTLLGMYEQMEDRSSDYKNNSEFFSCLEISETVSHQKSRCKAKDNSVLYSSGHIHWQSHCLLEICGLVYDHLT